MLIFILVLFFHELFIRNKVFFIDQIVRLYFLSSMLDYLLFLLLFLIIFIYLMAYIHVILYVKNLGCFFLLFFVLILILLFDNYYVISKVQSLFSLFVYLCHQLYDASITVHSLPNSIAYHQQN